MILTFPSEEKKQVGRIFYGHIAKKYGDELAASEFETVSTVKLEIQLFL